MDAVRLGGYPAKRCPRVVHNENAPGSPEPLPLSAEVQELAEGGRVFEAEVAAALRDAMGDRLVEIAPGPGQADATMAAMAAGAEAILGGRLPATGSRVGAPDVLVRIGEGYAPVDIKHHHTTKAAKRGELTYAGLEQPARLRTTSGRWDRGSHRSDDTLQLAHYVRMLEALGCSAGEPPRGGIIGTDTFEAEVGGAYRITWYDLAEPVERTYSASAASRRRRRSAMERYDQEFAFRIKVAEAARRGEELVRPTGTDECTTCVWAEHCASIVGPDDASFAIRHGRLRTREWQFLAARGLSSVDDLAALQIDDALLDDFALHAATRTGRAGAEKALRAAVERARLIRDDIAIEPRDGWPQVPTADVEVDFDLEWDRAGRIYQWGLRVREGQDDAAAHYRPVVSFEPLDADREAQLAEEFADRLEEIVTSATSAGRSLRVFHWSSVEVSRTRRFPRVAALLAGRTFDLIPWMEQNFTVRGSYSIKSVAPIFGFEWGVDDAGGFASMDRIETARSTGPDAEAARQWCLAYNEADVAAQAAIRDGLTALASSPPGE